MKKQMIHMVMFLGLITHCNQNMFAHGHGALLGATFGGAFGGIMGGIAGGRDGALGGMAFGTIGGALAGAASDHNHHCHHHGAYHCHSYYCDYDVYPSCSVSYYRPVHYHCKPIHTVRIETVNYDDDDYELNELLRSKNKNLIYNNKQLRNENNALRHELSNYKRNKYGNSWISINDEYYDQFKVWKNYSNILKQNRILQDSNKRLHCKNEDLDEENRYLQDKLRKYKHHNVNLSINVA